MPNLGCLLNGHRPNGEMICHCRNCGVQIFFDWTGVRDWVTKVDD